MRFEIRFSGDTNLKDSKFYFVQPYLRRITLHFIQKNCSVDKPSTEHYSDHQGLVTLIRGTVNQNNDQFAVNQLPLKTTKL